MRDDAAQAPPRRCVQVADEVDVILEEYRALRKAYEERWPEKERLAGLKREVGAY